MKVNTHFGNALWEYCVQNSTQWRAIPDSKSTIQSMGHHFYVAKKMITIVPTNVRFFITSKLPTVKIINYILRNFETIEIKNTYYYKLSYVIITCSFVNSKDSK